MLPRWALSMLVVISALGFWSHSAAALPLPDWGSIFDSSGSVIDLNGGVDAVFLEDGISAGLAVDMSVLPDPKDPLLVANGLIDPANDLGNGYLWMTTDTSGHSVLYGGVERFSSSADTFVRFEFYQNVLQVRSGSPWHVEGGPTVGDLAVQVNFKGGQQDSTEFSCWKGDRYSTIATTHSVDCGSADYWSCTAPPLFQGIRSEARDEFGNPIQVPLPDSRVQFGVNLASLTGCKADFTSVILRTPQDIILNSFGRIGYWSLNHTNTAKE